MLVSVALITGCSSSGRKKEGSKETPAVEERARYVHFEDVLIPHGLKLQMDQSFIYETPSLKAGKLVFSGRVEPQSLASFFTNNMERDGWKLVNKFGFKNLVLNFSKPDKTCMVNIYDRPVKTIVEIWLGPIGQ